MVALAWPLWQRRGLVRRRWWKLLLAALVGGSAASGSAVALAWALDLPREVLLSLVPKSATTPAGWAARGFALGTASHGIGAARALQVDAEAGAYAGIALSAQVILQSLLIPLAFQVFRG